MDTLLSLADVRSKTYTKWMAAVICITFTLSPVQAFAQVDATGVPGSDQVQPETTIEEAQAVPADDQSVQPSTSMEFMMQQNALTVSVEEIVEASAEEVSDEQNEVPLAIEVRPFVDEATLGRSDVNGDTEVNELDLANWQQAYDKSQMRYYVLGGSNVSLNGTSYRVSILHQNNVPYFQFVNEAGEQILSENGRVVLAGQTYEVSLNPLTGQIKIQPVLSDEEQGWLVDVNGDTVIDLTDAARLQEVITDLQTRYESVQQADGVQINIEGVDYLVTLNADGTVALKTGDEVFVSDADGHILLAGKVFILKRLDTALGALIQNYQDQLDAFFADAWSDVPLNMVAEEKLQELNELLSWSAENVTAILQSLRSELEARGYLQPGDFNVEGPWNDLERSARTKMQAMYQHIMNLNVRVLVPAGGITLQLYVVPASIRVMSDVVADELSRLQTNFVLGEDGGLYGETPDRLEDYLPGTTGLIEGLAWSGDGTYAFGIFEMIAFRMVPGLAPRGMRDLHMRLIDRFGTQILSQNETGAYFIDTEKFRTLLTINLDEDSIGIKRAELLRRVEEAANHARSEVSNAESVLARFNELLTHFDGDVADLAQMAESMMFELSALAGTEGVSDVTRAEVNQFVQTLGAYLYKELPDEQEIFVKYIQRMIAQATTRIDAWKKYNLKLEDYRQSVEAASTMDELNALEQSFPMEPVFTHDAILIPMDPREVLKEHLHQSKLLLDRVQYEILQSNAVKQAATSDLSDTFGIAPQTMKKWIDEGLVKFENLRVYGSDPASPQQYGSVSVLFDTQLQQMRIKGGLVDPLGQFVVPNAISYSFRLEPIKEYCVTMCGPRAVLTESEVQYPNILMISEMDGVAYPIQNITVTYDERGRAKSVVMLDGPKRTCYGPGCPAPGKVVKQVEITRVEPYCEGNICVEMMPGLSATVRYPIQPDMKVSSEYVSSREVVYNLGNWGPAVPHGKIVSVTERFADATRAPIRNEFDYVVRYYEEGADCPKGEACLIKPSYELMIHRMQGDKRLSTVLIDFNGVAWVAFGPNSYDPAAGRVRIDFKHYEDLFAKVRAEELKYEERIRNAVERAVEDLVSKLARTDDEAAMIKRDVQVLEVVPQTWSNGCVGWNAGSDMMCTMALVSDFKVVLGLYKNKYEYHAGRLDPARSAAISAINDLRIRVHADLQNIHIDSTEFHEYQAEPKPGVVTLGDSMTRFYTVRLSLVSDETAQRDGVWVYTVDRDENVLTLVKVDPQDGKVLIDYNLADGSSVEYQYDELNRLTALTFVRPYLEGGFSRTRVVLVPREYEIEKPVMFPRVNVKALETAIIDLLASGYGEQEYQLSNYEMEPGFCTASIPAHCGFSDRFELTSQNWIHKYWISGSSYGWQPAQYQVRQVISHDLQIDPAVREAMQAKALAATAANFGRTEEEIARTAKRIVVTNNSVKLDFNDLQIGERRLVGSLESGDLQLNQVTYKFEPIWNIAEGSQDSAVFPYRIASANAKIKRPYSYIYPEMNYSYVGWSSYEVALSYMGGQIYKASWKSTGYYYEYKYNGTESTYRGTSSYAYANETYTYAGDRITVVRSHPSSTYIRVARIDQNSLEMLSNGGLSSYVVNGQSTVYGWIQLVKYPSVSVAVKDQDNLIKMMAQMEDAYLLGKSVSGKDWDLNHDGKINNEDLNLIRSYFGSATVVQKYLPKEVFKQLNVAEDTVLNGTDLKAIENMFENSVREIVAEVERFAKIVYSQVVDINQDGRVDERDIQETRLMYEKTVLVATYLTDITKYYLDQNYDHEVTSVDMEIYVEKINDVISKIQAVTELANHIQSALGRNVVLDLDGDGLMTFFDFEEAMFIYNEYVPNYQIVTADQWAKADVNNDGLLNGDDNIWEVDFDGDGTVGEPDWAVAYAIEMIISYGLTRQDILRADLNGDGLIDQADKELFVKAFDIEHRYDLDLNGLVNLDDVAFLEERFHNVYHVKQYLSDEVLGLVNYYKSYAPYQQDINQSDLYYLKSHIERNVDLLEDMATAQTLIDILKAEDTGERLNFNQDELGLITMNDPDGKDDYRTMYLYMYAAWYAAEFLTGEQKAALDYDQNGSFGYSDWSALGLAISDAVHAIAQVPTLARQLALGYDADGSGYVNEYDVTYAESAFEAVLTFSKHNFTPEDLAVLDRNRDGIVSPADRDDVLASIKKIVEIEKFAYRIYNPDANGDNKVDNKDVAYAAHMYQDAKRLEAYLSQSALNSLDQNQNGELDIVSSETERSDLEVVQRRIKVRIANDLANKVSQLNFDLDGLNGVNLIDLVLMRQYASFAIEVQDDSGSYSLSVLEKTGDGRLDSKDVEFLMALVRNSFGKVLSTDAERWAFSSKEFELLESKGFDINGANGVDLNDLANLTLAFGHLQKMSYSFDFNGDGAVDQTDYAIRNQLSEVIRFLDVDQNQTIYFNDVDVFMDKVSALTQFATGVDNILEHQLVFAMDYDQWQMWEEVYEYAQLLGASSRIGVDWDTDGEIDDADEARYESLSSLITDLNDYGIAVHVNGIRSLSDRLEHSDFDADGNGMLNEDDVAILNQVYGHIHEIRWTAWHKDWTLDGVVDQNDIDWVDDLWDQFSAIDANNNGAIEWDELPGGVVVNVEAVLRIAARDFDVDQNGAVDELDAIEISALYADFDRFRSAAQYIDWNQNGSVDEGDELWMNDLYDFLASLDVNLDGVISEAETLIF